MFPFRNTVAHIHLTGHSTGTRVKPSLVWGRSLNNHLLAPSTGSHQANGLSTCNQPGCRWVRSSPAWRAAVLLQSYGFTVAKYLLYIEFLHFQTWNNLLRQQHSWEIRKRIEKFQFLLNCTQKVRIWHNHSTFFDEKEVRNDHVINIYLFIDLFLPSLNPKSPSPIESCFLEVVFS